MNRWGFSRAPRGPETGAYFHKLFSRDKPEMVLQMTSNSGNKAQAPTTTGGPLLPAPMMMPAAPGAMPFYMPQTQMAMLTPQQQQAFWHQQMQLYQFQQMQMFQFQQQQASTAGGGTNGAVAAPQPMMFPSMMMPMPMPIPVPVVAPTTTVAEAKAVKKEDKAGGDGNGNDDFPPVDDPDIDAETTTVGI